MKFPKLKNPVLSRITSYIIVLGCMILPITAVILLPFLPDIVKIILCIGIGLADILWLFKNFLILMTVDMTLACYSGICRARTSYPLPVLSTPSRIEKRISRFGKAVAPSPLQPQPRLLRYRLGHSQTIYASGIEKVIATYHTDYLDMDTYKAIFSSAKANSRALMGHKRPILLDKVQKKAPLNRITVAIIFAKAVDIRLQARLYDTLGKETGNEFDDCILPCVVDLQNRSGCFSAEWAPYTGDQYPVKNRGIRLIRRYVFGGRLPTRGNPNYLPTIKSEDLEMSLWELWAMFKKELKEANANTKKQFKRMADKEIVLLEDAMYIKWEGRGLCLPAKLDPDTKRMHVANIEQWSYPKSQPMAKKTIRLLQQEVERYGSGHGYTTVFADLEEFI